MHTTATPHHDQAWQLECACGLLTDWYGFLSAAVNEHTDHANNHARNQT